MLKNRQTRGKLMPIAVVPSSQNLSQTSQVYVLDFKEKIKKVWKVFCVFVFSKAKDVVKFFNYTATWINIAKPDNSQSATLSHFSSEAGTIKNFLSATEIPMKLDSLATSVINLSENANRETAGKVWKNTTALANAVCDSIFFGDKFAPIGKEALQAVKGVNYVATVGGSLYDVIDHTEQLAELNLSPERTGSHLLNIARATSFLALGVLGIASLALSVPFFFVTWELLACATAGLFFSIATYFWDKLAIEQTQVLTGGTLLRGARVVV